MKALRPLNLFLKNFMAVAGCCLLAGFLQGSGRARAVEKTDLRAEPTVFDFGTVREGVLAPVRFRIMNAGNRDISVDSVRTFAACVQSRSFEGTVLKPGETLSLEYVFESLGYGGVTIDKTIEIHFRDPNPNRLRLQVRGKVLPLETFQAPLGEMSYNFFVLIDLRPPGAFRKEHVIGSINVPEPVLAGWIKDKVSHLSKDAVVYLISESGTVSDKAAQKLRRAGWTKFFSLVGGLREWKRRHGAELLISGER